MLFSLLKCPRNSTSKLSSDGGGDCNDGIDDVNEMIIVIKKMMIIAMMLIMIR